MKKLLFVVVFGALALNCTTSFAQKKISQATIKTEIDTISYAAGVALGDQGLMQYLHQLEIVKDTAEIRLRYISLIDNEIDVLKKKKLQKELDFKLDSTSTANKRNLESALSGMRSSISAKDHEKAYIEGLALGNQISKMIESFTEQIYENKTVKMNTDLLLEGLKNSLEGSKLLVENASSIMEQKLKEAQIRSTEKKDSELHALYAEQIAAGKKFLEENKTKEGVVTLPDGLQYKILVEGKGAKPTMSDKVRVHYHGTLIDGTVFDSSLERGESITFGVGQVIKGWTEALVLMPVGSKWMLYIPADLAYGSADRGVIKPFSTLIFEVELLDIVN